MESALKEIALVASRIMEEPEGTAEMETAFGYNKWQSFLGDEAPRTFAFTERRHQVSILGKCPKRGVFTELKLIIGEKTIDPSLLTPAEYNALGSTLRTVFAPLYELENQLKRQKEHATQSNRDKERLEQAAVVKALVESIS